MKFNSKELKELFKESDIKQFVLPHFQRSFVWEVPKQKTLLSTFMVNLPTGNFLTLLGEQGDFPARNVCFTTDVKPSVKCSYLLDGQQRFSVLKNSFHNFFNEDEPDKWKSIWDKLYDKLRIRYFLNVKNTDGGDYFGYRNLKFDKSIFEHLEPSLLESQIIEKRIQEKLTTKDFFHPGYNPTDKSGNPLSKAARRLSVSRFLSEEFIVPLYEIYNSNPQSLHRKVLEKIAQKRCEELQAELEGKKKEIIDLLEDIDENIGIFLKNKDLQSISLTWLKLQTKWASDISNFLDSLLDNKMLEIELERNEASRAFAIFEIINLPGTPLSEYDLIVARAARKAGVKQLSERLLENLQNEFSLPPQLTAHINGTKPKKSIPAESKIVKKDEIVGDFKVRFLQMLSVISYTLRATDPEDLKIEHLKRGKFLSLKEEDINSNYDKACTSVIRAFEFLRFRCGIKSIDEMPYKLMVLPISYILLADASWKNEKILDRIEFWYWVSLFGGSYMLDQNSKALDDMISLKKFIKEKDFSKHEFFSYRFKNVLKVEGYSSKKLLMCQDPNNTIPGSIHKGILQYILSNQPFDFLEESSKERLKAWDFKLLEDHHICPLLGKKTMKETSTKSIRDNKKEILNSPLNRTLISKDANRKIGIFSPDEYFKHVSESSKFNHFINGPIETVYVKKAGESADTFYDRVCDDRYESLSNGIKKELLSLLET